MVAKHRMQGRAGASVWHRYGPAGAVVAAAVAAVVALVVTASGGAPLTSQRVAGARDAPGARPTPVARSADEVARRALLGAVSLDPIDGAVEVTPDAPVSVHTTSGRLSAVTLSAGSNPPMAGTFSADGRSWLAETTLRGSASYHWTVEVTAPSGMVGAITGSFDTLAVTATTTATVSPDDGSTVGVGQTVVVLFDRSVPAERKASVLSHLSVVESVPVPGGWSWFSERELHFRPQAYWPSGEQVTVTSNLEGWSAGDGNWGSGRVQVHFKVGATHISVADLAANTLKVTENGAPVATYAMSGGSERYPTMTGVHIAMDKEPVVHMLSSTVGIPVKSPDGYDEYVYDDVHITDSGEYVHAAPWSESAQGRANVSHGCINLGRNDAKAFYDFSQVGDIIEVINGPRGPETGDHGVMDWALDWSRWTPAPVGRV